MEGLAGWLFWWLALCRRQLYWHGMLPEVSPWFAAAFEWSEGVLDHEGGTAIGRKCSKLRRIGHQTPNYEEFEDLEHMCFSTHRRPKLEALVEFVSKKPLKCLKLQIRINGLDADVECFIRLLKNCSTLTCFGMMFIGDLATAVQTKFRQPWWTSCGRWPACSTFIFFAEKRNSVKRWPHSFQIYELCILSRELVLLRLSKTNVFLRTSKILMKDMNPRYFENFLPSTDKRLKSINFVQDFHLDILKLLTEFAPNLHRLTVINAHPFDRKYNLQGKSNFTPCCQASKSCAH